MLHFPVNSQKKTAIKFKFTAFTGIPEKNYANAAK